MDHTQEGNDVFTHLYVRPACTHRKGRVTLKLLSKTSYSLLQLDVDPD